jgi:hypothetical protein
MGREKLKLSWPANVFQLLVGVPSNPTFGHPYPSNKYPPIRPSKPKIIIAVSFFLHRTNGGLAGEGARTTRRSRDASAHALIVGWMCHYRDPPHLCPVAHAVVPQGVERR